MSARSAARACRDGASGASPAPGPDTAGARDDPGPPGGHVILRHARKRPVPLRLEVPCSTVSPTAKVMGSPARQEAQRFNHDYIGTEHVLLGLVQEGSGVAASA